MTSAVFFFSLTAPFTVCGTVNCSLFFFFFLMVDRLSLRTRLERAACRRADCDWPWPGQLSMGVVVVRRVVLSHKHHSPVTQLSVQVPPSILCRRCCLSPCTRDQRTGVAFSAHLPRLGMLWHWVLNPTDHQLRRKERELMYGLDSVCEFGFVNTSLPVTVP